MSLESVAVVCVVICFGGGFLLERLAAARPLPDVSGWTLRASLLFIPTLTLGAVVPELVAHYLAGRSPLHLASLGTWGGAGLGLVVGDLAAYWFHRAQHHSRFLWRYTHQLHHSAERVDVLGVGFFHPMDIALGALSSSVVVVLLGLSKSAVTLTGIVTLVLGVLQHLNVRTPVWLGYLVQRPESHSVHHLRGFHRDNYGNLALWDLVFATFQNPRDFAAEAGFYEGASVRVGDMLLGRDIQQTSR